MQLWIEAARPKTLVAGVVPVLVGTAASGRFIAWRFAAALVVGLSIQIGTNFANDYFDASKGVDAPDRLGPRRLTAAGLIAPAQMRRAALAAFAVAALAGALLAAAVGPELLLIGALSFLAAAGYSGGPRPYGAAGLGEVSVFLFFGLVATAGSAYVQLDRLTLLAVTASVPVGLLATALLVVNNLRDIETDRRAGKISLAVRLGATRTRLLYGGLVLGAFALAGPIAWAAGSPWPLVALLALPLAIPPLRLVATGAEGRDLIAALAATARLELIFGLLLAAGLWAA